MYPALIFSAYPPPPPPPLSLSFSFLSRVTNYLHNCTLCSGGLGKQSLDSLSPCLVVFFFLLLAEKEEHQTAIELTTVYLNWVYRRKKN